MVYSKYGQPVAFIHQEEGVEEDQHLFHTCTGISNILDTFIEVMRETAHCILDQQVKSRIF